jgi:adenine-specific DNA-methyltransferase
MGAFEDACEKISKLAETFQVNEPRYLAPDYQEAEARKDFVDKFFVALGWDVNHNYQTNPYEQEVKVERSVSAAGQRRSDYAFYLAPNYRKVRFFVEAKKPYGDIANSDNYFQTIRHGWNSETPLAVLTDFKQFHVLDCRYQPNIGTVVSVGPRDLLAHADLRMTTKYYNCAKGIEASRTHDHLIARLRKRFGR